MARNSKDRESDGLNENTKYLYLYIETLQHKL